MILGALIGALAHPSNRVVGALWGAAIALLIIPAVVVVDAAVS